MTIPYPLPRSVRQTDILLGDGGALYGPFDGFLCFDVEDIRVYTRPQGSEDFAAADVTVAKVSGLPFDFFTVTFSANLPVTTEYVVSSERVAERSAGVVNGTRIDPTALEKELSKIASTQQELRRDMERTLRAPFSQLPTEIPGPQGQRVLGWDDGSLVNLDPGEFVNMAGVATLVDLVSQISNLIATTLGGDLNFSETVALALAGKARLISTNVDLTVADPALNVLGSFPTPAEAVASISDAIILPTVLINVHVSGRVVCPTIEISGPYANRIRIIGDNTINVAVTGSTAGTGSAGDWTVTYTVTSSAGLSAGRILTIKGSSGELHWGAWKVVSVPDPTHVTVKVTTFDIAPPAGFTGTMTIFPSQLFFDGVTAFSCAALQILNLALDGNKPASLDTFGVICKERTSGKQTGSVYLNNVAVSGFGAEGVRANYGCVIHCIGVVVSNSGNNGLMARELSTLTGDIGCGSSGNGYRNIPGGNNGWLCQNVSSILIFSAYAVGNRGDGFFSRSVASLLVDNSFPAVAAYNTYDYHSQGAFMQGETSTSNFPRTAGFFTEGGIRSVFTNAKSFNSRGNAFRVFKGGKMDATLAQVTAATFNGFVADGPSCELDASASNVISCIGTPYIALDQGRVTMTNKTGLTVSSPAANTAPTGLAGYVKD